MWISLIIVSSVLFLPYFTCVSIYSLDPLTMQYSLYFQNTSIDNAQNFVNFNSHHHYSEALFIITSDAIFEVSLVIPNTSQIVLQYNFETNLRQFGATFLHDHSLLVYSQIYNSLIHFDKNGKVIQSYFQKDPITVLLSQSSNSVYWSTVLPHHQSQIYYNNVTLFSSQFQITGMVDWIAKDYLFIAQSNSTKSELVQLDLKHGKKHVLLSFPLEGAFGTIAFDLNTQSICWTSNGLYGSHIVGCYSLSQHSLR